MGLKLFLLLFTGVFMTLSDTQHTSSTQLLGCLCVCTPVWPSPKSGYSTSATLRKVSRGPSGHSPLPPPHAQSGLSFPGPQIHRLPTGKSPSLEAAAQRVACAALSMAGVLETPPGYRASQEPFICLFFSYGCTQPGLFPFSFFSCYYE